MSNFTNFYVLLFKKQKVQIKYRIIQEKWHERFKFYYNELYIFMGNLIIWQHVGCCSICYFTSEE